MPIALQNSQKVFAKVEKALAGANPASQNAFKALRRWLVEQKGNPDLQFIPFSAAQAVANGGYSPDVDACRVYGFYAKNSGGNNGTDSYVGLHNAADNNSGGRVTGVISAAYDEFMLIYPKGLDFATELTVGAATGVFGTTESAAAHAADGFVIIGSL